MALLEGVEGRGDRFYSPFFDSSSLIWLQDFWNFSNSLSLSFCVASSKVFKGDGMRIKKKIFFIYIEIGAPMIIFSRFLLFSGLCAACMLARVEQERLESLKYDRATIYIKCVEDNEDTKSENDSEVRIS